jgi:uncharacterized protein (DUF3084 family)
MQIRFDFRYAEMVVFYPNGEKFLSFEELGEKSESEKAILESIYDKTLARVQTVERELKERNATIKEREEKLKERDETIKERDEKLKERDEKLKERDEKLKERDEKLKERDEKLKERDETIRELSKNANAEKEKRESAEAKLQQMLALVVKVSRGEATAEELAELNRLQQG